MFTICRLISSIVIVVLLISTITRCVTSFQQRQHSSMKLTILHRNEEYKRKSKLIPAVPCSKHLKKNCRSSGFTLFSSSSLPISDEQVTFDTNIQQRKKFNTTLSFPSYTDLMQYQYGEYVVSEKFTVQYDNLEEFDFCVKLYPRGGGHTYSIFNKKEPKSGFGMAYRTSSSIPLSSLFGTPSNDHEKLGVYLQYLPRTKNQNKDNDDTISIDASFGLTLMGKQKRGPKFNVEWRAGMRFVPLMKSKLASGQANDFGAHLMQTKLLASFLEIDQYNDECSNKNEPLELHVDVTIHQVLNETITETNTNAKNSFKKLTDIITPRDTRISTAPSSSTDTTIQKATTNDDNIVHDIEEVRVGRVIVPLLTKLSQRPKMFAMGVYPGVEYRILRIIDPITDQDIFYSQPDADYEIKPIYPLVPQLERQWPVRINEKDIPRMFTPVMYNVVSAIGSLITAGTGLLAAFIISQAVSFYYIPSRSMEPTLQIGDILLVEKVTPRLEQLFLGSNSYFRPNDVILFTPPQQLMDIVKQTGGKLNDRDLFIKRIAAVQGDTFTVIDQEMGNVKINDQIPVQQRNLCESEPLKLLQKYLRPSSDPIVIEPGTVAVLGDCSDVSIDSRVWGPLPIENIVGRPIARLWPLSQFGSVPMLPTTTIESPSNNPDFWSD